MRYLLLATILLWAALGISCYQEQAEYRAEFGEYVR